MICTNLISSYKTKTTAVLVPLFLKSFENVVLVLINQPTKENNKYTGIAVQQMSMICQLSLSPHLGKS